MTTGSARPSAWLCVRGAVVDRLLALALVPFLGPAVAVLAWRVRAADRQPGLIGLDRVGRQGRVFAMWKLRSMRVAGTAGPGAAITAVDDERITPIGARLRRHRLDELPQLANVLRGDMALLGPRPEAPGLVDLDDPAWARVLAVRPGVAGPTQLVVERWEASVLQAGHQEDRYRAEVLPVKLAIDRWYVEGASVRTDALVVWSMVERFVLGRAETGIQRRVRREVPEAARVPIGLHA